MENIDEISFQSSHGNLITNLKGYVLKIEDTDLEDEDNYLVDIQRVDLEEYKQYRYSLKLVDWDFIDDDDILCVGFWKKDGSYESVNYELRKNMYEPILEESIKTKLDNFYLELSKKYDWFEIDDMLGTNEIVIGDFIINCTPFWQDVNGIPIEIWESGDLVLDYLIQYDYPKTDDELLKFKDFYEKLIIRLNS